MLSILWQRYQDWWESASLQERWAILTVGIATLLGATYRFIDLRITMQFLADQGRDVITAYGIFHGDIALVGPSTSVGNMFLGPFYYYFMAPWLALFGNDPIGPTVAVAVIGVITIPFLYWVGKQLVGIVPAVLATLAFTVSPVAIEYTRFSWNPNPAPFVMLVLLYATWKAWKSSVRWWLGVAIAWAILIQLHYVALLSIIPAGIFWLADIWRTWKNNNQERKKGIFIWTFSGVISVLLSWLPLVVFDFRFDHLIFKGFLDFFDGDNAGPKITFSQTFIRVVKEQHGRAMHMFFEIWGGKDWTQWYRQMNSWLLVGYLVTFVSVGVRWWNSRFHSGFILLLLSAFTSVAGLAWYEGVVFHHYITYLLPVSYLLTGVVITEFAKRFSWLGVGVGTVLLGYILWLGVLPSTLVYLKPLGWTVDDFKSTSQVIYETVPADASYGLTHLSDIRDYRGLSYRYFLLDTDHPPVSLEESPNADYLVIVADNPKDSTNVLGSPVYEVVVYPKGEYTTLDIPDGPRLYFIQREKTEGESIQ